MCSLVLIISTLLLCGSVSAYSVPIESSSASTTYSSSYSSEKAYDGTASYYCSLKNQPNQWLQLDLANVALVDTVAATVHYNIFGTQVILIGESGEETLCGTFGADTLIHGRAHVVVCDNPHNAVAVRLHRESVADYLAIEEIKVNGVDASGCPDIKVAHSETGSWKDAKVGDEISVQCKSGYERNGAETITCGGDGAWSPAGQIPTCRLIGSRLDIEGATSSSVYSSKYGVEKAYDNDISSYFCSQKNLPKQWVDFKLTQEAAVYKIIATTWYTAFGIEVLLVSKAGDLELFYRCESFSEDTRVDDDTYVLYCPDTIGHVTSVRLYREEQADYLAVREIVLYGGDPDTGGNDDDDEKDDDKKDDEDDHDEPESVCRSAGGEGYAEGESYTDAVGRRCTCQLSGEFQCTELAGDVKCYSEKPKATCKAYFPVPSDLPEGEVAKAKNAKLCQLVDGEYGSCVGGLKLQSSDGTFWKMITTEGIYSVVYTDKNGEQHWSDAVSVIVIN